MGYAQKTIDKIEAYRVRELKKAINRLNDKREEARGNLNDTGYDRYYNAIQRCEKDLELLEEYKEKQQAQEEAVKLITETKAELAGIKKALKIKIFYLQQALPGCAEIKSLVDYVEEL